MILIGKYNQIKYKALPVPSEKPGVIFSFSNVSYSIKNKVILNEISGRVNPGQILAILGPSGKI